MNHLVEWAGKKSHASAHDSFHPGSGALVLDEEPIWPTASLRLKNPSRKFSGSPCVTDLF